MTALLLKSRVMSKLIAFDTKQITGIMYHNTQVKVLFSAFTLGSHNPFLLLPLVFDP